MTCGQLFDARTLITVEDNEAILRKRGTQRKAYRGFLIAMSYISWLLIAAFGLSITAGFGQAQAQTQTSEGPEQSRQVPIQSPPLPFHVKIIEDQGEAATRNRREVEASQREIEDLAAQQGMYSSTQSIEAATNDMRDYALYSVIAVWIGTFLLFATLWFTHRAIRVTRDIGRAQIRAYVGLTGAKLAKLKDGNVYVVATMKNFGNSPAIDVKYRARKSITITDLASNYSREAPFGKFDQEISVGTIGPGASRDCAYRVNPLPDIIDINELLIVSANFSLSYRTVFDGSRCQQESVDARIGTIKIPDLEIWDKPMEVS